MRVAEVVTNALAQPFLIAGGKLHVSASIGAAIYPDPLPHRPDYADEAMYHAKQTGGGVRLFSRSIALENCCSPACRRY